MRRAVLEIFKCLQAFILSLITVNGVSRNPGIDEKTGKTAAGQLGIHKNQHLAHRTVIVTMMAKELSQGLNLALTLHFVEFLRDRIRRGVLAGNFNQLRVLQELAREFLDFRRERRREHEALNRFRNQVEDPGNIRQESHIEHTVGFIEHNDLNLGEIHSLLLDVIKQTSRSSSQHLNAAAKHIALRADINTAIHHADPESSLRRISNEIFIHLIREFAGRGKNQGPDGVSRRRRARIRFRENPLQHRQAVARSLSRTRLSGAHDVPSGKHERNGLRLNRGRAHIAHCLDSIKDPGIKLER